ncbi:11382_t:CDS:2 [Entrophospora sp. SA101]|nr:11382_t:CDS:2 [Entrophospora sp. SA101]
MTMATCKSSAFMRVSVSFPRYSITIDTAFQKLFLKIFCMVAKFDRPEVHDILSRLINAARIRACLYGKGAQILED